MAEKKITKREQFEKVVAILEEQEQTELVTFIQHEIELLDKKKSSKKKSDNTEQINEIYGYLVKSGRPCKVNELIAEFSLLPPAYSSAKITYYLGELVKGTNTYTTLAEEETEEV